jgi:hypothetical protein
MDYIKYIVEDVVLVQLVSIINYGLNALSVYKLKKSIRAYRVSQSDAAILDWCDVT